MNHRELAERLLEAKRDRAPILPLTSEYPTMTVDDAYRIQREFIARAQTRGARIIGYKVGLTSKAMQRMLGVFQPDYGPILDSMRVLDGSTLDLKELIAPRLEAEIAFLLNDTLQGPGVSRDDVMRATEAVTASLEIIDSRIKNWDIKLADTIADHASSSHVVISDHRVPPSKVDLRAISVVIIDDEEQVASGRGDAVMGHPADAVAWVANTLGRLGIALEESFLVMPGALHTAIPPKPGHRYTALFDQLGTVSVAFRG